MKKNRQKKGVFRHFLENFDQKIAFFRRAPTSYLVYIGAIGAFRTFLGSITKNGYWKIVQRGDLLGRQGVEFLRGRASAPLPKSAPAANTAPFAAVLFFLRKNFKKFFSKALKKISTLRNSGSAPGENKCFSLY